MNDFSSSFWVNGPRWRTPIGEQTTSESPTENSFWLLPPRDRRRQQTTQDRPETLSNPRRFVVNETMNRAISDYFAVRWECFHPFCFTDVLQINEASRGCSCLWKKMAAQCATLISHLVFIGPCIWNSPPPDAFLAYRVTWNATLQQDPGKNASALGLALKRSFCSREQMCNTSFTYKGTLLTWINWNEKRVVSRNTLAETIT